MTDETGGFPLNDGYIGQQNVTDGQTRFNAMSFIVQQILAGIGTSILVEVKGVSNADMTVDVQPMVNQVTGAGVAVPHGTVFKVPFFRLQGGLNGVVCDPQVGDIGLAVISMRDISSVKANRAVSNPGSGRCFDLADSLYIGGYLNPYPTCRVAFVDGGITVTPDDGTTYIKITPGEIILKAAKITTHATEQNAWDVDGTGFVYKPDQIDTYTDGVPSGHHAPNPPEVPT